MRELSHEQKRRLLEVFDSDALKRLAVLGEETTRFFRTASGLRHFEEVEASRAKAVIDYFRNIRVRRRMRDNTLDIWILSSWTHHGLWAFSNEGRRHLMNVWFERFPERPSFKALSSADAFRMHVARLKGLIGWSAFPHTYPEAPLRFDPVRRLIESTPGTAENLRRPLTRLWKREG